MSFSLWRIWGKSGFDLGWCRQLYFYWSLTSQQLLFSHRKWFFTSYCFYWYDTKTEQLLVIVCINRCCMFSPALVCYNTTCIKTVIMNVHQPLNSHKKHFLTRPAMNMAMNEINISWVRYCFSHVSVTTVVSRNAFARWVALTLISWGKDENVRIQRWYCDIKHHVR